ncbi:MAG: hypothetical protein COB50_02755 [Thiotrichales bacterium]|nr:MAG: hypothetical protein COB50_02755 [Thiotrichales bacterium]
MKKRAEHKSEFGFKESMALVCGAGLLFTASILMTVATTAITSVPLLQVLVALALVAAAYGLYKVGGKIASSKRVVRACKKISNVFKSAGAFLANHGNKETLSDSGGIR